MPRRIAQYARKLVVLDRYVRTVQVLIGVAIPAVLAVTMKPALEAYANDKGWTAFATIATVLFAFQVALGLLFALLPSNPATAAKELVELDEEIDDIRLEKEAVEEQRDRASAALSSMAFSMTVLQELPMLPPEDRSLEGDLERLLFPFVSARADVFGFLERDLYNFAVYWINDSGQTLESSWRQSSHRLLTEGKGRSWPSGEGHVGLAFQKGSLLVADDLVRTDIFRTGKATDSSQYRSAASVPFFKEGKAVGVFVVTGDRPGMFTEEIEGKVVAMGGLEPVFENIGCLLTVYATSFRTAEGRGG